MKHVIKACYNKHANAWKCLIRMRVYVDKRISSLGIRSMHYSDPQDAAFELRHA